VSTDRRMSTTRGRWIEVSRKVYVDWIGVPTTYECAHGARALPRCVLPRPWPMFGPPILICRSGGRRRSAASLTSWPSYPGVPIWSLSDPAPTLSGSVDPRPWLTDCCAGHRVRCSSQWRQPKAPTTRQPCRGFPEGLWSASMLLDEDGPWGPRGSAEAVERVILLDG
jgi:hypothetical protein